RSACVAGGVEVGLEATPLLEAASVEGLADVPAPRPVVADAGVDEGEVGEEPIEVQAGAAADLVPVEVAGDGVAQGQSDALEGVAGVPVLESRLRHHLLLVEVGEEASVVGIEIRRQHVGGGLLEIVAAGVADAQGATVAE